MTVPLQQAPGGSWWCCCLGGSAPYLCRVIFGTNVPRRSRWRHCQLCISLRARHGYLSLRSIGGAASRCLVHSRGPGAETIPGACAVSGVSFARLRIGLGRRHSRPAVLLWRADSEDRHGLSRCSQIVGFLDERFWGSGGGLPRRGQCGDGGRTSDVDSDFIWSSRCALVPFNYYPFAEIDVAAAVLWPGDSPTCLSVNPTSIRLRPLANSAESMVPLPLSNI